MLCPTPPQQQQPQSLQALARSQSLCLRQSQSPRTSQRCRSLNYNSGNDADYSPDFSNATIEFVIKGLNSLNIKKNLSRLPLLSKGSHDDNSNHYKQQYQTTGSDDSNPTESLLLSVSPHADTDQDELGNVTRVVIPIRVCLLYLALVPKLILTMMGETVRDSLLPSSIPRISTDYDEPGNPAVGPSGSNPSESAAINIGWQDEHNDFGQPHHRTRVTALELTFMLVGFNLEILSAGFDQVSSTSKPRYALISLLLAVAAVFTCIWELIYNGMKERDASPNSTVFGTLPDIFGLGLAVIQCVCSAVQYYFLHHHHSNPMKLSPVPLFFFSCLVVLKLKGN
ncbi:uncharacterized protein LOC109948569 isoform X3 [Prunus persica]|uniref:uncharacterized protein LOC109948569 isoform X3 n=1 Tax=Prunus persica TaxID=3760 RepID=UPI0009AB5AB1|nr:uncharacterized protein LOC109948569 isoform X3 [Prunus persica]